MKAEEYLEEPTTIGEHVKRVRVLRGLFQREAARLIGVTTAALIQWERGRSDPSIKAYPGIFGFLGYDPFPPPASVPERMLATRRAKGWSLLDAARRLGVDEGTWRVWENGTIWPWPRHLRKLEAFLKECT